MKFWAGFIAVCLWATLALSSCADVSVSGGGAQAGNSTATNNQPVDSNNNTTIPPEESK
jgi:hypothetical protein